MAPKASSPSRPPSPVRTLSPVRVATTHGAASRAGSLARSSSPIRYISAVDAAPWCVSRVAQALRWEQRDARACLRPQPSPTEPPDVLRTSRSALDRPQIRGGHPGQIDVLRLANASGVGLELGCRRPNVARFGEICAMLVEVGLFLAVVWPYSIRFGRLGPSVARLRPTSARVRPNLRDRHRTWPHI